MICTQNKAVHVFMLLRLPIFYILTRSRWDFMDAHNFNKVVTKI